MAAAEAKRKAQEDTDAMAALHLKRIQEELAEEQAAKRAA